METIVDWINKEIEELKKEAQNLLDTYWQFHIMENEARRNWGDKSMLGCRMKKANGTFYLEWYTNKWVASQDPKQKRRPLSRHLSRGRTMQYPDSTLLKHCQPWEAELVLHTEKQFSKLRIQAHYIVKARVNIGKAIKVLENNKQKNF